MRPRLLDLFCGAGGAAMGYHRAGFDVVGVDIRPQPNYPFEFLQADALEFLSEVLPWGYAAGDFVAVHSSPPCQAHTALNVMWNAREHADLVGVTRDLLKATGLPYVIENVVGAPLIDPVMLCGSSLGLGVRRHRLFETNWPLMVSPCVHGTQRYPIDVTGTGGPHSSPRHGGGIHRKPENLGHARKVMEIDWMSRRELSQAIPPAYTELIGHQLLRHIEVAVCA